MAAHRGETEIMNLARSRASFDSSSLTSIIYEGEETLKFREAASSRVQSLHKCEAFMQIVRKEGSYEQQWCWLPLVESEKITGSLALIELGHSASLGAIETTAVYDSKAQEFILNSPTATSTKIWSAGLGSLATHAVVAARLIISLTDYGPHSFIVPIRSIQTLECLPGVESGDPKAKVGVSSIDNSYVRFNTTRIPQTNMLMGLVQVQLDGTYSCQKPRKTAEMDDTSLICSHVIKMITFQLAQAATIVTRFSTVKTDGHGYYSESPLELPLIHKKSQHSRLLSLHAQVYALLFTLKICSQVRADEASSSSHIQSFTAGLTAYSMHTAVTGVEEARKCCEGHGHSFYSGLPIIALSIATHCSRTGDSTALYEQMAEWLMGQVWLMKQGKDVDDTAIYLTAGSSIPMGSTTDKSLFTDQSSSTGNHTSFKPRPSAGSLLNPISTITGAFHHRARRLVLSAADILTASTKRERLFLGARQARNTHTLLLVAAAHAHTEVLVLTAFAAQVARISNPRVAHVMQLQLQLYGLNTILAAPSFFEDGFVSLTQADEMRAQVNRLHAALVPEVIALTDAWAFGDAELKSAIGGWDGDVHETLMRWVRGGQQTYFDAKDGGGEGAGEAAKRPETGVATEKSRL